MHLATTRSFALTKELEFFLAPNRPWQGQTEMPSRILLPYPSGSRPFPQFSWSRRRDKGQRQTDRHQGRFPESRNDLEEPAEREMGLSRFESARRADDYCRPQNVASGLTNSKPASHASWLRQTTSASALRPVSAWISRTSLRSGRSAPTTAMQPEWLTSTVTALARSFAPPCSHSTRSFTREMKRLWLRNLSHLSCAAMSKGWGAMLVVMIGLAREELMGLGWRLQR